MGDIGYLLSALCAGAIFGYKLRPLRKAPREVRRTILPLCLGGLCVAISYLFAAPTVAEHFNRFTGVPNLAILTVYIFAIGMVCCGQLLVINWRYEPKRARPFSLRILAITSAVIVAMCALFWLGPHVEERHHDFPAAFARTPYLAEFLTIYFGAYLTGICEVIYQSWRGARETPRDKVWLRRGIRLTAIGMLFPAAYAALSLVAIVAAWFGKDFSYLSVDVAPKVTTLGVPEFLVAISIVSWGPRLPSARKWISDRRSDLRDYLTLGPLWQALRQVDPNMVHAPRTLFERVSLEFRLFWRVVEIDDWLERLREFNDPNIQAIAAQRARDAGLPSEQITAVAEAAQIRAALLVKSQGQNRMVPVTRDPSQAPENKYAFATERTRLILVARALESPLIAALLEGADDPKTVRN